MVRVKNHQSGVIYLAGVPQGSILGPLSFSLHENNLPNVCLNSNIQMYADDTVVFVHAKSAAQAADPLTNNVKDHRMAKT